MLPGECALGGVHWGLPAPASAGGLGWTVSPSIPHHRERPGVFCPCCPEKLWDYRRPQCPHVPPQGAPCMPGMLLRLALCKGGSLCVPKYSVKGISMPC